MLAPGVGGTAAAAGAALPLSPVAAVPDAAESTAPPAAEAALPALPPDGPARWPPPGEGVSEKGPRIAPPTAGVACAAWRRASPDPQPTPAAATAMTTAI